MERLKVVLLCNIHVLLSGFQAHTHCRIRVLSSPINQEKHQTRSSFLVIPYFFTSFYTAFKWTRMLHRLSLDLLSRSCFWLRRIYYTDSYTYMFKISPRNNPADLNFSVTCARCEKAYPNMPISELLGFSSMLLHTAYSISVNV